MLEHIIIALVGVSILGGAYLVDLIIGVTRVIFTESLQFSWKKVLQDFVRALLIGASVIAYIAVFDALAWYGTRVGANLDVLNQFGIVGLTAAIVGGSAWYLTNAGKNLFNFLNSKGVKIAIDTKKVDYASITKPILEFVESINATPKEAIEAHKTFEVEGGTGAVYSVPIDSYDAFRNRVNGNAYDLDGAYGPQCWDGAALLWQQIGRSLSTGGTGIAAGCWNVESARNANAGGDFDLIWNLADVKRGDVVVLGRNGANHIAFADEDYNGSGRLVLLGQNQGDGAGINGKPFNVISVGMSGFSGAFRFKRWVSAPAPTPTPEPTPEPTPTPTVPNNPNPAIAINVGDTVVAWGRGYSDSDGRGPQTRDFPNTDMKVIGANNGYYALNQYNGGTPGNVSDATGWWPLNQVSPKY